MLTLQVSIGFAEQHSCHRDPQLQWIKNTYLHVHIMHNWNQDKHQPK